jgi:hypothetical protein
LTSSSSNRLKTYPGGMRTLAQALGELLSRVQATRVFPDFVNYPDIVARLFAHVRRTGLFLLRRCCPGIRRRRLARSTLWQDR